MGTSDSTGEDLEGKLAQISAWASVTLRSDLPDDADTGYWEEAFTQNKTKPTSCGHSVECISVPAMLADFERPSPRFPPLGASPGGYGRAQKQAIMAFKTTCLYSRM